VRVHRRITIDSAALAALALLAGCRHVPAPALPDASADAGPVTGISIPSPHYPPTHDAGESKNDGGKDASAQASKREPTIADLEGIATDGPFTSLATYCSWFQRDCRRGDARLCRCEIETAGLGLAVVRTRDLGREDEKGMSTNFTALRPAFRRPDGWRVAASAPDYLEGAETSYGGTRTRALLERATNLDVVGDGALEAVFVLRFVSEDSPLGATPRQVSSTTLHVVICGDAKSGYCTKSLAQDTEAVPRISKGIHGQLVVGGDDIEDGPQSYRLVFAPRAR
jgi:hypothetical protein